MSNFNSIKSMWENKVKADPVVPPTQPISDKSSNTTVPTSVKAPQKDLNQVRNTTIPIKTSVVTPQPPAIQKVAPNPIVTPPAKKEENQVKPNNNIPSQMPRKSVFQLKQNLQGLFKPGMGLSRPVPPSTTYVVKPQQNQKKSEPKQQAKEIIPQKKERAPSFIQSKANLEKMMQRKKVEPEGYHTGPVPQPNHQTYIDLKKSQSIEQLTPQQRTEQIMKRVFSEPEKSSPQLLSFLPEHKKQESQNNTRHNFLGKHQQVTSLNLRSGKKERINLGNFDDA